MPILSAAPLVIIAQAVTSTPPAVVYAPPPAPPPAPGPGSPYYAEQRANREATLRRRCYSETAIRMILADQDAAQAPNPDDRARERALLTELSTAADAEPLDLDRLQAAHAAWRGFQAKLELRREQRSFELLRRLPPADRVLYARGFALYQRFPPRQAPTCEVKGRASVPGKAPSLPPLPARK
jgi:hypothetical protein